jgi:hypothetical protein
MGETIILINRRESGKKSVVAHFKLAFTKLIIIIIIIIIIITIIIIIIIIMD